MSVLKITKWRSSPVLPWYLKQGLLFTVFTRLYRQDLVLVHLCSLSSFPAPSGNNILLKIYYYIYYEKYVMLGVATDYRAPENFLKWWCNPLDTSATREATAGWNGWTLTYIRQHALYSCRAGCIFISENLQRLVLVTLGRNSLDR